MQFGVFQIITSNGPTVKTPTFRESKIAIIGYNFNRFEVLHRVEKTYGKIGAALVYRFDFNIDQFIENERIRLIKCKGTPDYEAKMKNLAIEEDSDTRGLDWVN